MKKRIAANPGRCIGCRTCEIACALAHSELRIEDMTASDFKARVAILKHEDSSTPVACRQCEDAPCASACPCGAIVADSESVNVLRHKCIGCKACIMACPYGVMRVTSHKVRRTVCGKPLGFSRKALAQKCDLCASVPEGPSCVRACPTNVLFVWRMKQCNPREQQHFSKRALVPLHLPPCLKCGATCLPEQRSARRC